jgi:hypothetical protein
MQLRERASVVVELVIASVAVVCLVLAPRATPQDTPRIHPLTHRCQVDVPPATEAPAPKVVDPAGTIEMVLPEADALYRARQFGEAAQVARTAAEHDARYRSVAELYIQFSHAWDIAMMPAARTIDAFEALREARKLDVVLGGVYAGELDATLVRIAPRAAISYAASHRVDEAELAVSVAESLGVESDNVKAVRAWLRHHRGMQRGE